MLLHVHNRLQNMTSVLISDLRTLPAYESSKRLPSRISVRNLQLDRPQISAYIIPKVPHPSFYVLLTQTIFWRRLGIVRPFILTMHIHRHGIRSSTSGLHFPVYHCYRVLKGSNVPYKYVLCIVPYHHRPSSKFSPVPGQVHIWMHTPKHFSTYPGSSQETRSTHLASPAIA
ncbi:hypothetical protein BJ508DRAFT_181883 [Ascobolus immersus RN42]|uniref:Uncharacterized protein n=1 Tax=Ascobolus immersus RN42 TaxID=1160509 RepID=A0A3N4HS43_ASCIM|nr:hypothetical protein BJ508DRAFT_181883 [Ascobolus immersus RN42]